MNPSPTRIGRGNHRQAKNLTICPKCGVRILVVNEKHLDNPDCLVRQTANLMEDTGWKPAGVWHKVLVNAGFPTKRALMGWSTQWVPCREVIRTVSGGSTIELVPLSAKEIECAKALGAKGFRMMPVVTYQDGNWGPVEAVEACRMLMNVGLSRPDRARAVRMLVDNPELMATVESTKRLGGRVPKEWFR